MAHRKQPPALAERVGQFIRQHRLTEPGQKVAAAVSGGADSVCLLHILNDLRNELEIDLHIAHLDHQLRGAESEADARYVTGLAGKLGIPATIERRDVKAYQRQHRLTMEEAAREVRYAFLAEVAGAIGASSVAVGHTADDHIETILMHLIRGTGTRGLRGLLPAVMRRCHGENRHIIRPLLEVSREETDEYCRSNGLEPRLDSTNLSLSPLRNRIRHELLPLLKGYNRQVTEALRRLSRITGDDLAFIEQESERLWDKVAQEQDGTTILNKAEFLKLPVALKRHILRTAIEKQLGNLKDIETRHIEEIMDVLSRPAGKKIHLPGGLLFATEYGRYLLGRDPCRLSPFPELSGESKLTIPGVTEISGWRITAEIMTPAEMKDDAGSYKACLDLGKTGTELSVRRRRRGDRFQPLGLDSQKKLGEFMIDARIPRDWRDNIPIVGSNRQIIWVVGYRIDERVKVRESTKKVLSLRFEPD